MRQTIRGLVVVAVVAVIGVGRADDKPAAGPKADPKDTPLELSVTGKTVKYTLDTGGLTAEEYAKKVGGKGPGRPLPPPAVDLVVQLKNTSDKAVRVWAKGDPVVLALELKGKGAVNAEPLLPSTLEFRIPEAVEIAPGKTVEFPVKMLRSGYRGMSRFSYWTAPGEYELVATLKTAMQPPPAGAKVNEEGFGVVALTSAPLKLTVEEKK